MNRQVGPPSWADDDYDVGDDDYDDNDNDDDNDDIILGKSDLSVIW